MFYNARSCRLALGGDTMNYIRFGAGPRPLVILPGLGDGFAPVHGQAQAAALALGYRLFARDFTVYLFSRKNRLQPGCTTAAMADDLAEALRALGISGAAVLGVSQGGAIAQQLAVRHPGLVGRLVLAVTYSRQNETVQTALRGWMELAERGDHRRLMISTAERSYSQGRLKKYRLLYPVLGFIGKPKSYDRFLLQAAACLGHDCHAQLGAVACPTLVIGGGQDRVVGPDAGPQLAAAIPNSELFIYPSLGHAAYEEAPDFNARVLAFLLK